MTISVDLSDRVVIVTGAAGGLGSACVRRFSEAGATVVLVDLDGAALGAVEETTDGPAWVRSANLALRDECRDLVSDVMERFGRVDSLIACAGVMQTQPFLSCRKRTARVSDINQIGTFFLVQAAAEQMVASGGGSIVLFASVAARSGRPFGADYAASKTALLSLTKSAALALAPTVRVNAVCPGIVLTSMWDGIMTDHDKLFGTGAGDAYRERVESRVRTIAAPDRLRSRSNAIPRMRSRSMCRCCVERRRRT